MPLFNTPSKAAYKIPYNDKCLYFQHLILLLGQEEWTICNLRISWVIWNHNMVCSLLSISSSAKLESQTEWFLRMKVKPSPHLHDQDWMCGFVFCTDINQHMKELLQGVHHLVSHILNKEQQLTGSFDCENYIQLWSNYTTSIQSLIMKTQQTQIMKKRQRRKRDCSKDENKMILLQKFLNTDTLPSPSRTYRNLLLN